MGKEYDADQVISELKKRGAGSYICPFCQGNSFSVHEKIATITISGAIHKMELGHYIPSAILICKKCGNLSFFALAGLGILEEGDSSDGKAQ